MAAVERICKITGARFSVSDLELEHIAAINHALPELGGQLGLPSIHPLEALRRITAFTNFVNLFRSPNTLSGKPILSRYHPSFGTRVCTAAEFWSQAIDNTAAGRPFDFGRSFFEQWKELFLRCYLMNLFQTSCEGSEYSNGAANLKDCYLCFNTTDSQDCMYCLNHFGGNDNLDCVGVGQSQFCYSCVNVESCYACRSCSDCVNSSECFGCVDLIGCQECFGCVGLRNLRHHIFNQRYAEAEYRALRDSYLLHTHTGTQRALEECHRFIARQQHHVNHLINAEGCSGNYLRNCNASHDCYFSQKLDSCSHTILSTNCSHSSRLFGFNSEFCYESVPVRGRNELFSYADSGGEGNVYCGFLEQNSSRCFGCIALKGRSYCILNLQYSKEEYYALVPRIVEQMRKGGEWGDFLPPRIAPHHYQHSAIPLFYQAIPEEELVRRGYRCGTPPSIDRPAQGTPVALLDSVYDTPAVSSIGPICCEESGRPFSVQKKEIDYHRRHGIALPRRHWELRLSELARSRGYIPAAISEARE